MSHRVLPRLVSLLCGALSPLDVSVRGTHRSVAWTPQLELVVVDAGEPVQGPFGGRLGRFGGGVAVEELPLLQYEPHAPAVVAAIPAENVHDLGVRMAVARAADEQIRWHGFPSQQHGNEHTFPDAVLSSTRWRALAGRRR